MASNPEIVRRRTIFGTKVHYAYAHARATLCGERVGRGNADGLVNCGHCARVLDGARRPTTNARDGA